MNDDLLAFALKSTVDEIKNACPDVSNTFIFKNDGSILAKDDDLDEETVNRTADIFKTVSKKADTIGGLESATFYSENNRVSIFKLNNNLCLALVGSEEPDGDRTAGLARILVPTVVKLTERIINYQQGNSTTISEPPKTTGSETEEIGTHLEAKEIKPAEDKHKQKMEITQEIEVTPEPLVTQLMVEDSGRFAGSNSVRIDSAVVQQWKDLYGEKEIAEVEVETLGGQKLRCKYKLIGDSKLDGKGLVQLPQKMQLILNTSKGELVTVKPVI